MDLSSIQQKMNERSYRAKNPGTTKGLSSIIPKNMAKHSNTASDNSNLQVNQVSDQKVSDQRVGDQKVSDQKVSDQKVSDQRVGDLKVSDLKVSDLKVSDQRVSDQRVSDQRVSDQRVRLVEGNLFNKLLEKHGFRVLNKLTSQETLLLDEIIKKTSIDNEWVTLTRVELESAGIFSNKLASLRNKLAGIKDERFKYRLIEFETFKDEKNKEKTRYRVVV